MIKRFRIQIAVILFLSLFSLLTFAASKTTTNKFGEKVITTTKDGITTKEIFFTKKRKLRISVPNIKHYRLILRFPTGKVITDEYKKRVHISRLTAYKSGLTSLRLFMPGKPIQKKTISYPSGDKVELTLNAKGKKKEQITTYKNGSIVKRGYNKLGKKTSDKTTYPYGKIVAKNYKEGKLLYTKVEQKDNSFTEKHYQNGKVTKVVNKPKKGFKTITYFQENGQQKMLTYIIKNGSVSFTPRYKNSSAITLKTLTKDNVSITFLKQWIFADQIVKVNPNGIKLSCIPNNNLLFQHFVAGKLFREKNYLNRIRNRETIHEFKNGKRHKTTTKKYDSDGNITAELVKYESGRVESIVYEVDNTITKISEKGIVLKKISKNKKGKTYSETFDSKGQLKETILFDKFSHLFKMKEIFTNGKLYLREKFFKDGRLVRSKYNKEGNRIGLYWKKWK